jgi:hypothetical protein
LRLVFEKVIRMNAVTPIPSSDAAAGGDNPQSELAKEVVKAHALVERLGATGLRTVAEVLQELRRAFPDSPLDVRVRALESLRRR